MREIIARSPVFSTCSGEDSLCDSLANLLPYSQHRDLLQIQIERGVMLGQYRVLHFYTYATLSCLSFAVSCRSIPDLEVSWSMKALNYSHKCS
jgi:hypothetical protein